MLAGGPGEDVAAASPQPSPGPAAITKLPLGAIAGAIQKTPSADVPNPYEGSAQAEQQGKSLFISMNCAGCHGYGAKGGMGPNLTDAYWRYGGVPAMIFNSIYEGRPQGMPAWNPALPTQEIWKIVAYIETLGGTYPPGQYQAWLQGDKHGDIVPTDVAKAEQALGPGKIEGSTPAPNGGSTKPPGVPPAPDVSPPTGTHK
jgi:cytochrome c oxidase cbb3-type subunit 3